MHRSQDCSSAGHVAFHGVHALGGLQVESAAVEGDALADQCEMERRTARAIAQPHQSWWSGRAATDRHQTAVPVAAQCLLIQYVDRDLPATHQIAYLVGE